MINVRDLAPAGGAVLSNLITGQRDPQLAYMWDVQIEGDPSGNPDVEESNRMYARTVFIPQRSVEDIDRRFLGEEISHPGAKNAPNQVRITFWIDRSLETWRYLSQWLNSTSDPTNGRGANVTDLKRVIRLRLRDRSNFFIGGSVVFSGARISQITEISLSYDENAPMVLTANFKFDTMVINETTYSDSQLGVN